MRAPAIENLYMSYVYLIFVESLHLNYCNQYSVLYYCMLWYQFQFISWF